MGGVRLLTDEDFLENREVQRVLRRRRRHEDCPVGVLGACEVVEGNTCEGPRTGVNVSRWNLGRRSAASSRWAWTTLIAVMVAMIGVWCMWGFGM